MVHVTVINSPEDVALAERIRADLQAANITLHESLPSARDALLVIVLSAGDDVNTQKAIIAALENQQHILLVKGSAQARPPRLIDHLQPLDFSQSYDTGSLLARVRDLARPDAPPPLAVLTPARQAANRRAGYIIAGIALFMFIIALLLIALADLEAPAAEYNAIETEIILTRNYFIDNDLPRTTEQAANFPVTLDAAPTRSRDLLIATATAIAGGVDGTFIPRSTDEAANFPATLQSVSTVIQDRLAATVTAASGLEVTPTPGD